MNLPVIIQCGNKPNEGFCAEYKACANRPGGGEAARVTPVRAPTRAPGTRPAGPPGHPPFL